MSVFFRFLRLFLTKPTVLLTFAAMFLFAGGVSAAVLGNAGSEKNLNHSKSDSSKLDKKTSEGLYKGSTEGEAESSQSYHTSSGTQGSTPQRSTGNTQYNAGYPAGQKKVLRFSPGSLTLPRNGLTAAVEVSAADGSKISGLSFSNVNIPGLIVTGSGSSPSPAGGVTLQTTWQIMVRQIDMSSSGSATLQVSSWAPGSFYEGSIKITWNAQPDFYVVKGALDRVEGPTTITYTMHFTLVPNNPYFGNPTIYARVFVPGAMFPPGVPMDFCDGGVREKSFQYNGQNEQTLTCIENKPDPYVPGSGPPPPLASSFILRLDVYGKLGGDPINGGTGLSEIEYIIN